MSSTRSLRLHQRCEPGRRSPPSPFTGPMALNHFPLITVLLNSHIGGVAARAQHGSGPTPGAPGQSAFGRIVHRRGGGTRSAVDRCGVWAPRSERWAVGVRCFERFVRNSGIDREARAGRAGCRSGCALRQGQALSAGWAGRDCIVSREESRGGKAGRTRESFQSLVHLFDVAWNTSV